MTSLTTTQGKSYIAIDRPNSGQPPAHNHYGVYYPRTKGRGLDCHEEEEAGRRGRRGDEEDGEQMESEETFRKFGINLGSFRTGAEILAELHLKYPWVKVVRRITRIGNALLVPKDDRTRKLLTEMKYLNGKTCSFQPNGQYVQEDLHLDDSPILHNGGTPATGRDGTRGHTDDKVEQQHKIGKPHRHGEGSFDRENNQPYLTEGMGASE